MLHKTESRPGSTRGPRAETVGAEELPTVRAGKPIVEASQGYLWGYGVEIGIGIETDGDVETLSRNHRIRTRMEVDPKSANNLETSKASTEV